MSNTNQPFKLYIGFDDREASNYAVCVSSACALMDTPCPIQGLVLETLEEGGLYTRETQIGEDGQLWDPISVAPMSTKFAISRFLVPILAESGWAMFCDCDTLFLSDPISILDYADPSKAVMCVKHNHVPLEERKKEGALQTKYDRKNWSSVMLFNCDHPSNKKLTLDMVNSLPGRDLHRFCWLEDDEIGELPVEWNFLVGVSEGTPGVIPHLVHWTNGSPALPSFRNTAYADEYFTVLRDWAEQGGYA